MLGITVAFLAGLGVGFAAGAFGAVIACGVGAACFFVEMFTR